MEMGPGQNLELPAQRQALQPARLPARVTARRNRQALDADESTRTAVSAVIAQRLASRESAAYLATQFALFPQFRTLSCSHVVVERELVRVRPDLDRQNLVLALEADPRVDQVRRENAPLSEVLVVRFQTVDHCGQ